MKYRSFGRKLDWEVSALGFGALRLPLVGNDVGKINEPEATKMIRYAIDHGVNYVDTGYTYHKGKSEAFLGKVLRGRYRQKIRLATKMPTWLVESEQDMDKYLNEQLRRLNLDYVDFYLLHALDNDKFQKLRKLNVFKWAEKKIDEGKFKDFGFSFHDRYDVFKKIIDSYNGWTLCQIQFNYVNPWYQAGQRGLRYAASKGLAVIIMGPIAGGRLATNPPEQIQRIWASVQVKRSLAEWALMWIWNHPEVSVVLSGMSTMRQVIENIESAELSDPGMLSRKELLLINQVVKAYKRVGLIWCTYCRYCLPCPEGVNIPEIISLYNEHFLGSEKNEIKKKYSKRVTPEGQAWKCKRCGRCEKFCPQELPIMKILSKAATIFE